MHDGGIQNTVLPFYPAWVRRVLLLMVICVFGFETTAFAGQAPVRLDDIHLTVQVGPSDEVSTPYGVTFRTSIKIDDVMPDERMYIFIWHASHHQGFEPNTHTVLLADFFPFRYGEGDVATDEEGNTVLFASHTTSDDLLPGLTYFARAHVVAVNKSDFDQETHTFHVSYASDFSEEVSFMLPSQLFLKSDLRYFLIDRYYRWSDDEYALVEEGEEEILYLKVLHDTMPKWFGDGDLFAELKLGASTARPLPEVGDVVIFAQDLYDPQFMKNPLEVIAIDEAGHDILRIAVKQLPRHQVIEGDMDVHLKADTSSGQAEIGPSPGTYDRHEKDGPPAGNEAKESLAAGRFIAHDNGTVLDTRTNLMWAAKDNGSSINWADAKSYCENFRGGGYTDWRMPTQEELAGLYDAKESQHQECYPAITIHVATDLIHLTCCCPWASETQGSRAAGFNFENGSTLMSDQSSQDIRRALPVRSAAQP